jgi:transcriptional regulator with XRE-family HTH domain
MAKKLTPQDFVRRMMETLTQAEIGDIVGLSKRQVQRIAAGETSGASVEAPLREFAKLGKRAKAAVVAGNLDLPSKRTPAPKPAPVEAPEPKIEAPSSLPSAPARVEVEIRGNMGPSRDPDYIRKRTIRKTLEGEYAREFARLWDRGTDAGQAKALKYAVSAYFGGAGEGHLESVIGTPSIKYIREV